MVESRDPRFSRGDKVLTSLGWQSYGVAKAAEVTKVDARRAPASYYLGVLGMPGITAWFGLFEIGQPKAGETVVVSAASGAVGSVVGQLAKIQGCRVVGIAGGKAKCDYVVDELGFDACVDQQGGQSARRSARRVPGRRRRRFRERRRRGARHGAAADEPALAHRGLRPHRRVQRDRAVRLHEAALGARQPHPDAGHDRVRLEGSLRRGAGRRSRPTSPTGKLKYRESIVEGLDNAPRALIALLKGENFGKQLVRIA